MERGFSQLCHCSSERAMFATSFDLDCLCMRDGVSVTERESVSLRVFL